MTPGLGRTTARSMTAGSRNFRMLYRLRPGPPLRAVSFMKRTRTLRPEAFTQLERAPGRVANPSVREFLRGYEPDPLED